MDTHLSGRIRSNTPDIISTSLDWKTHVISSEQKTWTHADNICQLHVRGDQLSQCISSAGPLLLILLGRAFDGSGALTAKTVLERYCQLGIDASTRYEGSHLIVIYDSRDGTFTCVNSCLGYHKLYYRKTTEGIEFSTRLAPLIAQSDFDLELDEIAMGQFLTCSHLLDARSLAKGIDFLSNGMQLTFSSRQLTRKTTWTPEIFPTVERGKTVTQRIAHLRDIMESTFEMILGDEPILFPISGGLDSRFLASVLPGIHERKIRSVTFGPPYCDDVVYGSQVARELQLRHQVLSIPTDYYERYLPWATDLADGEISLEALPMLRLLSVAPEGSQVVSGFLGDLLSGGHLPNIDGLPSESAILEHVWKKNYVKMGCSESDLKELLQPELFREVKNRNFEIFRQAFSEAAADTYVDKATLVELKFRQLRYINYHLRALASHHHPVSPFLMMRVVMFFLSLPLEDRRNQYFYRELIIRTAPALARIKVGGTNRNLLQPPLPKKNSRDLFSLLPPPIRWRANLLKNSFGRALAQISGGFLGDMERRHYVSLAEDIRNNPEWFRNRLLGNPESETWFKTSVLEQWLQEHLEKRMDHSIRLANVLAILEWKKRVESMKADNLRSGNLS